jgi:hypothetical protein
MSGDLAATSGVVLDSVRALLGANIVSEGRDMIRFTSHGFPIAPEKKPVDHTKVAPFQVVRSPYCGRNNTASKRSGYTVKAPPEITYYTGPGNTAGWYRTKGYAQIRCDIMNEALKAGRLSLVAVDDKEYREYIEIDRRQREYADALGR